MKSPHTAETLATLDDEAFREVCRHYPHGHQWEHRKAFNYACIRLANMQGLRVHKPQLQSHEVEDRRIIGYLH